MFSQTKLTTSQPPGAAATALPGQAATVSQSKRLLFVDNLRILLICGVLVAHLNVTYGGGNWMYHDPTAPDLFTGAFLWTLGGIGMACGMGLFFLLAGYFTPRSYDRKGGAAFVRDRLIRLGIPWLVYSLLLQPLVVYIAQGLPGSFWSFYIPSYLHGAHSIADGPIWFVELLLFFSLIYATWRWLTRQRMQTTASTGKLPSYLAIFGFICALGLVTFVVRLWWPAGFQPGPFNVDLGYLPQYISLYVVGIVASRRNWFFTFTPRMGRDWSLIALLATLPFYGLVAYYMLLGGGMAGKQPGILLWGGFNWLALCYALWESFVVVGVGIGLLVLFRQRLNHQGRLAKELAADVYTVYLIHPVVLVGFAYAFSVVALYPLLKWGIAVVVTIPLCFLISSGIRRIPLVNRVL